ncbi:metallophosphoesterase [Bacteroidales bacterium OttesenSCG-928-A17]|nr:metallophosphoesterase [Bacteroidales bacterium OttesenSCG-928-A17]
MKKTCLILFLISFSFSINAQTDGPYLLYENGGLRVITSDKEGKIEDVFYKKIPKDFSFEVCGQGDQPLFSVKLHPIKRPDWKIERTEKVFITSDPHGNLECFADILKAGKVIDENYNWVFGANQLVVIGDIFDRGKDVLPLFWLVYKLEEESSRVGGAVHVLLGNHEEMVLRGDFRYMEKMYSELADKLEIPYQNLWHENSELGRWLQTRNAIQIIGDNLFVHAGLSSEFLSENLNIQDVNQACSVHLFQTKEERKESELANFLFGSFGPLWYRGMVRTEEKYKPVDMYQVDSVLEKYGVNRIYVGHTIFPEILGTFADKVIDVNVDNKENRKEKRSRAILLDKDKVYSVYDSGALLEKFKF